MTIMRFNLDKEILYGHYADKEYLLNFKLTAVWSNEETKENYHISV